MIACPVSSSFVTRMHLKTRHLKCQKQKSCIFEPCQEIDIFFATKMSNTSLLLQLLLGLVFCKIKKYKFSSAIDYCDSKGFIGIVKVQ